MVPQPPIPATEAASVPQPLYLPPRHPRCPSPAQGARGSRFSDGENWGKRELRQRGRRGNRGHRGEISATRASLVNHAPDRIIRQYAGGATVAEYPMTNCATVRSGIDSPHGHSQPRRTIILSLSMCDPSLVFRVLYSCWRRVWKTDAEQVIPATVAARRGVSGRYPTHGGKTDSHDLKLHGGRYDSVMMLIAPCPDGDFRTEPVISATEASLCRLSVH